MAALAQQVNSLGLQLSICQNIGDDLLAVAYLRWKEDGTLAAIFHEGEMSLRAFLEWHVKPNNVWLGCFVTSEVGGIRLAGIGWVNSITKMGSGHVKAEVGMSFFREYQQPALTREWTEMLIDYCFDQRKIDFLYGTTPARNRAAVLFSKRMGFEQYRIPNFCSMNGELCDAVGSYLDRDLWERHQRRGR